MSNNLSVFLLMGQSNMAGRGRLADVSPLSHPDVVMFRDGRWMPATEPLHTDKPVAGACLGMSFAVELAQSLDLGSIGLVASAVGGTPLSRWMPGGDLYENAVSIAGKALENGELKGVLWHQGEHDSCRREDTDSYGERFQTMIETLRSDLSAPDIPVIAGELGPFLRERDGCAFYGEVNRHFRELEERLPAYACARAEGLTCNGDNLHFNAASLREFGQRYAQKYLELTASAER